MCVYTCLGSDHLVCFTPGFPFPKSFRDGCSLGTFSRFDLFLQPILRGKAEANTDSANRSRSQMEGPDSFTVVSFWVVPDFNGDDILP